MRTAHIYGLVALAFLTTALTGVLGAEEPEPVASSTPASIYVVPTRAPSPQSSTTTTTPPLVDREPDLDAHGRPTLDLLATTTTIAVVAKAPAPQPTTPTTEARAADTTTTAPPAEPEPAGGPSGDAEATLASKINGLRSNEGLAPLQRNGTLDAEARAWAERMADQGSLSHSNLGRLLPPWSAAAENVGSGGSASDLFGALAGSSGHRSNMLGDYTHLGVGAWVDGSGTIWTVHLFTH